MEIIPAIDIKQGKCVRLYQGDYSQETIYSLEPAVVAQRWESQGATRIHIVDLDGAAQGKPQNMEAIKTIINKVKVPLQLGGGLRHRQTVERLLELGIERVVLGTAAVEDPLLVEELCISFGDRIVVSIDAQDGLVASHGWKRKSTLAAAELARRIACLGARRLVYTDISRDGTLTSPNFLAIAELLSLATIPIIAAGGISSLAHLERLAGMGVEAAIVGKALYTGDIDLPQALNLAAKKDEHASQV